MNHRGFSRIGLSTPDLDKPRQSGHQSRPSRSRGLLPFAFEAGSAAALAEKRDELRARGVAVTDIVDHGWAQSIYFKDPNGVSLEYCCIVRNLTEDDATIQDRFTIPRDALELSNTVSVKAPVARSRRHAQDLTIVRQQHERSV